MQCSQERTSCWCCIYIYKYKYILLLVLHILKKKYKTLSARILNWSFKVKIGRETITKDKMYFSSVKRPSVWVSWPLVGQQTKESHTWQLGQVNTLVRPSVWHKSLLSWSIIPLVYKTGRENALRVKDFNWFTFFPRYLHVLASSDPNQPSIIPHQPNSHN